MKERRNSAKNRSVADLFIYTGLFLLAAFSLVSAFSAINTLSFPPGLDQDLYLESGKSFCEQFLMLGRAPLYSVWMGIIYFFSNKSLENTFWIEKIISVLLLSLTTGVLVWKIFNKWTGILAFIWVLNLKYMVLESNGSHSFSAILIILSLICLKTLPDTWKIPVITLGVFLSAQVRSEMYVPLILILIYLVADFILSFTKNKKSYLNEYTSLLSITVCIAAIMVFYFTSKTFIFRPEHDRVTATIKQNFAVNYLERKHDQSIEATDWKNYRKVWDEVLPGADSPLDAIQKYPSEFLAHITYNIKLFAKAIFANIASFSSPVFGLFFLIYCVILFILRRDEVLSVNDPQRRLTHLIVMFCLATLSLIPISIVLRVAARYYIQLIPIQILFIIAIIYILFTKSSFMKERFARKEFSI